MTTTKTDEIAFLNDLYRESLIYGGRNLQSQGINALPFAERKAILEKVKSFDAFTPDNDPYGERDFGAFDHNGQRIFWKIDYYSDRTLTYGSEDPTDPQTVRMLTIMLASEY